MAKLGSRYDIGEIGVSIVGLIGSSGVCGWWGVKGMGKQVGSHSRDRVWAVSIGSF
jgi:hypothetical protein